MEIYGAEKDIQGNRKYIATHYGAEVQDTLPLGDYVLLVKYDGDVATKTLVASIAKRSAKLGLTGSDTRAAAAFLSSCPRPRVRARRR